MPRKVTLPCRSLSCSRSDLSCCVSLCLKQYHPTYLHESPLSIRENVYRYFPPSPPRFAPFPFHNPPRYFNFDRPTCRPTIPMNFKNYRIEKNFFLFFFFSNGKRFRRSRHTLLRYYLSKRKRRIDRPSRGEKQGRSFVFIGDRINRNNFSNRQQFNRDRQQWRVQ